MDKLFYNESSAAKLGWYPSWFIPGHEDFDDALLKAIRQFQRAHSLKADGLCGPGTFRRLQTERETAFKEFYDDVHSGAFPEKKNIVEINENELDIFLNNLEKRS